MGTRTAWRKELFKTPFIGWWCRCVGAFPVVKRGAADRCGTGTALQVLEMGRPLVLFPEDRRSSDKAGFSGRRGRWPHCSSAHARRSSRLGIAGSPEHFSPPGSIRSARPRDDSDRQAVHAG